MLESLASRMECKQWDACLDVMAACGLLSPCLVPSSSIHPDELTRPDSLTDTISEGML